MDGTTLFCRALLATVFAVSGAAKLRDRTGTLEAVAAFGVPARLVPAVAAALPPAELVVAASLVPHATAPAGSLAALTLLVAFSAAVGLALAQGRRPRCSCFGSIGSSDVSGRTLVRNGVLAVAAVAGVIGPGSVVAAPPGRVAAAVVAGVLAAGLVVAVEAVTGRREVARTEQQSVADVERSLEAGTPGTSPLPAFVLDDLDGTPVSSVEVLRRRLPVMLVFLSATCGACTVVAGTLARWSHLYGDRLQLVAVVPGSTDAERRLLKGRADGMLVLVDAERELRTALDITSTPASVLASGTGLLRGPVARGAPGTRRLLAAALSGEVPDLDGTAELGLPVATIELDTVLGPRPTVTVATVAEPDGEVTLLVDEDAARTH